MEGEEEEERYNLDDKNYSSCSTPPSLCNCFRYRHQSRPKLYQFWHRFHRCKLLPVTVVCNLKCVVRSSVGWWTWSTQQQKQCSDSRSQGATFITASNGQTFSVVICLLSLSVQFFRSIGWAWTYVHTYRGEPRTVPAKDEQEVTSERISLVISLVGCFLEIKHENQSPLTESL